VVYMRTTMQVVIVFGSVHRLIIRQSVSLERCASQVTRTIQDNKVSAMVEVGRVNVSKSYFVTSVYLDKCFRLMLYSSEIYRSFIG
jgi:hypothetical protein